MSEHSDERRERANRQLQDALEKLAGEGPGRCAHCGRRLTPEAGYAQVKGANVCHPRIPDGPDCYTLIVTYGEQFGQRVPAAPQTDLEWLEAEKEDYRLRLKACDQAVAERNGQILELEEKLEEMTRLRARVAELEGNVETTLQEEQAFHLDGTFCRDRECMAGDRIHVNVYAAWTELDRKLTEMTRLRDNAIRQLNREDTPISIDTYDLIHQGLDEVVDEWEGGDEFAERLVRAVMAKLHPDIARVEEAVRREQARAAQVIEDLTSQHEQVKRGLAERANEAKARLDAVVNEVFTVADSHRLADKRSPDHLYSLGRCEGLSHARFAVLRGLGVFQPNHVPYVMVERLNDLRLLRLAINDPGAYTEREEIRDGEYESVGNWSARAVQIALREGRGDH